MIKINDKVKDLEDGSIWIIIECCDLHNVWLKGNGGASWLACFDPNCYFSDVDKVEFLNGDKKCEPGGEA